VTGGSAMRATVGIRGGPDAITVDPDALLTVARVLDSLATAISAAAFAAMSAQLRPPAALATTLNPIRAAARLADMAKAAALLGYAGAQCELLTHQLRFGAHAYLEADRLRSEVNPVVRAASRLPRAGISAIRQRDSAALVREDPALAGAGVAALALVVAGPAGAGRLFAGPTPVESASRVLSSGYPDLDITLVEALADTQLDEVGPPRDLHSLIEGLDRRNSRGEGGAIDVRLVTRQGPHGSVRRAAIVDITGTREWNLPLKAPHTVADLGTNLREMGGRDTGYERGVLLALERAGVKPDEPVMLVGHSQGGMVATRLAQRLSDGGDYHITHVVTAGSPVGSMPVPSSVTMLSLENRGDLVPELDGADNPTRRNRYTVSIDRGPTSTGGRHSIGAAYLPGAADVDASRRADLAAWYASADPFLSGTAVRTLPFTVRVS
jgi:PGAP1-like protein